MNARLGVSASELVRIASRRGQIEAAACVTNAVQPGHLFMPMHYGVTNQLTRAEFDPHSRQPSYKHCAVRLEPPQNAGARPLRRGVRLLRPGAGACGNRGVDERLLVGGLHRRCGFAFRGL